MDEQHEAAPLDPLPFRDPLDTPYPDPQPTTRRRGKHTASRKSGDGGTPLWTVLTLASLAILIVLLLSLLRGLTRNRRFQQLQQADQAETLAEGITVDGVSVAGLTRAQASGMLRQLPAPETSAFEYRIRVQDRLWFMSETDIPLNSNLTTLINQAYGASRRLTLSRGETVASPLAARAAQREQIRTDGLALSSMTGYRLADITRYVNALADSVDREPVSAALASVDFSHRAFTFSDDIPGIRLDRSALINQIAGLLEAGETSAEIDAQFISTPARLGKLRLMNTFGCLELRSIDTETTGGDAQIHAMMTALNGAIIPTGTTFSLRQMLQSYVRDLEQANAERFASALFDAGICAGMTLVERAPDPEAAPARRGLEAHLGERGDLRLKNTSDSPLCLLCYYTPLNSRGTRGSITLELYGILREGGETAELAAEVTATVPAGAPEYQVNEELEPGTTLLRREARDGATVDTLLVKKVNGKVISKDIICTSVYPPAARLIETGP